jgi:hypothetical protein
MFIDAVYEVKAGVSFNLGAINQLSVYRLEGRTLVAKVGQDLIAL